VVDLDRTEFSTVEVVTQTYVVEGRCRGLTEYQRLVDMLNKPEVTHLQILDPKIRPFSDAAPIDIKSNHIVVDKMRIFFASTIESPQDASRRETLHRIDRVEKDAYRILVFAPPFRIEGTAHLARGADLTIALPKMSESFAALTDATIVHEADAGLTWEHGFLVVNGHRIEMACSPAATARPADNQQPDTA
jgi:hypothetical protein